VQQENAHASRCVSSAGTRGLALRNRARSHTRWLHAVIACAEARFARGSRLSRFISRFFIAPATPHRVDASLVYDSDTDAASRRIVCPPSASKSARSRLPALVAEHARKITPRPRARRDAYLRSVLRSLVVALSLSASLTELDV